MGDPIKTAPMDAAMADRLLDLLSTDDGYRARFQQDPRAALEEIGYRSPAPGGMTACGAMPVAAPEPLIGCSVEDLAPKEAIAEARSEIRAMLTSGLSQQAPKLDTGLDVGRRTRR